MKYLFSALILTIILASCKNTKESSSKSINLSLFYGLWKVDYIRADNQKIPRAAMGNPQYEFTKDGYRIKSLNMKSPPPPDSAVYQLKDSTISYPENAKLPSLDIVLLTKDSLVLKNQKTEWRMYK